MVTNQTPTPPTFDGDRCSTFEGVTCRRIATTLLADGTPSCDEHASRDGMEDENAQVLPDYWVDPE